MNASQVMTRSLVSIGPDASILEAAGLMLEHKVSGLPVIDESGDLVGVVTEGDFLRREEIGSQIRRPRWIEFFTTPGRLAGEYVHASGRKVRDVMSGEVRTVTEETELSEIARLMQEHAVKRLPVVRDKKLIGIVTRADLLRAVVSSGDKDAQLPEEDVAIRGRLLAELKNQPWAVPLAMIDISVKHGVVELAGVVRDDRQRQALRVAAENVPGVKKVMDGSLRVEPVLAI
jgi:CBS domain-containing protein